MTRVSFVPAPNPGFEVNDWWKTEAGLLSVTSEYMKLAYYWFRYGHGLVWCAGVVVAMVGVVAFGRCQVSGSRCQRKRGARVEG
jgi:hypothetical protein